MDEGKLHYNLNEFFTLLYLLIISFFYLVNGIDQLINEKPEPSALQQLPTIEPDKYADCDLSTANNEELITIIHYLREKNMNYQKDILNAIQDRNRFADIIEKTNNSLITLKV